MLDQVEPVDVEPAEEAERALGLPALRAARPPGAGARGRAAADRGLGEDPLAHRDGGQRVDRAPGRPARSTGEVVVSRRPGHPGHRRRAVGEHLVGDQDRGARGQHAPRRSGSRYPLGEAIAGCGGEPPRVEGGARALPAPARRTSGLALARRPRRRGRRTAARAPRRRRARPRAGSARPTPGSVAALLGGGFLRPRRSPLGGPGGRAARSGWDVADAPSSSPARSGSTRVVERARAGCPRPAPGRRRGPPGRPAS